MNSLLNFVLLLISLCIPGTAANNNSTVVYSNTSFARGSSIGKPGCPSKCGDLTVPYPFGIGANGSCSINPFFDINCDTSFEPPKAFLGSTELEVLGIFETKIQIKNQLAMRCYDQHGDETDYIDFPLNLSSTPFSISNENKLTVVGCDVAGIIMRDFHHGSMPHHISSCMAVCINPWDLSNGLCSGMGCCQTSIRKGLQSIYATMATFTGHAYDYNFNRCGYTFLAEENSYTFNISDISDSSFVNKIRDTVPFVIDWAISNQTCDQIGNTSEIICQGHSVSVDSGSVLGGYHCNCSQGYHGNPYLSPGCQDINECEQDPCHQKAKCINLEGSFNCSCPPNHLGDGTKLGTGCIFQTPLKKVAMYAGSVLGSGLLIMLSVTFWLYKILKMRRAEQLKQKLFKRLLQRQMSAHDSVLTKLRIFKSKELERATDQFNEIRILGRGGQGTVYKGMLSDGRIVAVKKSKQVNENQIAEFINEVVILSQINHRNVVNLLGCCLETEVPLLIYEFIPNGTLYDLIHDQNTGFPFSWDLRLTIATEIANALAYLHHAISIPIYHRDMKSTNILLDEKYRAKLSDFGISRSVSIDQTHLTTKVKGTFGYLDPEYFHTGKFTEKSDVYSFGVVLIELLTGQKPVSTITTEEERSLVTRFLLTMEENRLKTILDSRIIEQGIKEEHIAIADLAKRCLNSKGKNRPRIKEVASELESIKTCQNPSFIESDIQDISSTETESFVNIDDGSSPIQNAGRGV